MEVKIEEQDISKEKKIVGVQIPMTVYYHLLDEAEDAFMTVPAYIRKLIMDHTKAYKYYKAEKQRKESK